MKRYEYKVVSMEYSQWTGKVKADYLEVLNVNGTEGWKFYGFTPGAIRPKGAKGVEMIFEREKDS